MNVVYISFLNEDKRPGYKTKIHSQVKALSKLAGQAYLYTISNSGIVLYSVNADEERIIDNVKIKHKRKSEKKNIYDEMFTIKEFTSNFWSIAGSLHSDMIYIRRIIPITPWILKLIKKARKINIYVAYEYPTYPWKREMLVTGKRLFYYIDLLLYKTLFKQINQLVCFGEYGNYSNKVVETMNGIDVELFPIHKKRETSNNIDIIAIGHIMPQHGYDKLIRGLKEYYSADHEYKVILHIVGEEMADVDLHSLAYECGVTQYIKFWGYKTGDDLNAIFDQVDIGVDCLALNRIESTNLVGSLKSREYLARGIPFVFAGNLDFVRKESEKLSFVLEVREDTDSVDINSIVQFYKNCTVTPEKIREYAKNNLSWDAMMKKVIDKYYYDLSKKGMI